MNGNFPSTTAERFFAGLAEQTFQTQLGVADARLIDYLSDLLIRFLKYDALFRIRTLKGRPVTEVGAMVAEADARIGSARFQTFRHIGDFTLFWAGLYPEALRAQRDEEADRYAAYCAQGKWAYGIARKLDFDDDEASNEVLERLSDEFEMCAYGLREVRREWERRDDKETPRLFILE